MPHATLEVIEPDFRIRCWRYEDCQTHWEVFLKKRAFSRETLLNVIPKLPQAPLPSREKGFSLVRTSALGMEQPQLLTHSSSWQPSSSGGQVVSKPGLTDASAWETCQGVCTWKLLGGNFPNLAGPGHSLVQNNGGWGYTCSFCWDECVGF